MKKMYLFSVFAMLSVMIAAQDLTIMKFSTAPVIDGEVDPIWEMVTEVPLTIEADDDYGPVSINEAWFKMGWNDTALFMLLYRDDDDFADRWKTGLDDWQSDRDEIFIDVNVDTLNDGRGASDAQQGASYGHYQFTSMWVQDATEWTGMPSQWYHNAPFHFGYKFDGENAYYTEYAWPFSSLTINTSLLPTADATFQGGAGVTFGLEVVVVDVDMADNPTDESFRKFIKWQGISGWATMDDAGQVLMSDNVITGINDSKNVQAGLSVYPVPANDFILLKNLSETVNVEIYDISGQIVLRKQEVTSSASIDISSLTEGTYFIRLNNGMSQKFVKQ